MYTYVVFLKIAYAQFHKPYVDDTQSVRHHTVNAREKRQDIGRVFSSFLSFL